MKVEWQEYLSTGVLEIDIQHKLLFEKYNAFLAAVEAERGPEEIGKLFWFLEAYTVTHFREEEEVMQRLGHTELPRHRMEHHDFVRKVLDFKERLKSEGPTPHLILTTTRFISTWLINHISVMDRAIGKTAASKTSGSLG